MVELNSDALTLMRRMLDIAGTGSSVTELDDGNLTQVVNVNDIVRRSRTQGISSGWYICMLRNVHSGADDESSEIDPYAPGDSAAGQSAYPSIVQAGFDVWICGAWVSRSSGAGELTAGELDLDTNASAQFQGWAQDDSGAAVSSGTGVELTQWELLHAPASGVNVMGIEVGTGLTRSRIVQRVRRGLFLRFNSTSAAAATFDCNMLIGLFPSGLGQDIVP